MLRMIRSLVVAAVATVSVAGCAPVAQNTAQSLAYEQQQSAQIVRELDQKGLLMKDQRLNSYVNGVVGRIAAVRPPGSVPLRAYIIRDADVNAFTTGGGYVFFNAGMLAAMENEAQFATVAAHEIAHIDRGHVQASRQTQQTAQLGAAIASIAGAAAGIDPNLVNLGVGLGAGAYTSNFSRSQETDADNIGIRYLAAAGYNGVEGAQSFAVMQRLYGGGGGFLASHPASSDRLASLVSQSQALGAADGRIGRDTHAAATRDLRRDILKFYEANGRNREAQQIRRNLR